MRISALFSMFLLFVVWEAVWKGIGLWRSARLGSIGWFVAILVINSLGILPMIYILMTRDDYRALQKNVHPAPPARS